MNPRIHVTNVSFARIPSHSPIIRVQVAIGTFKRASKRVKLVAVCLERRQAKGAVVTNVQTLCRPLPSKRALSREAPRRPTSGQDRHRKSQSLSRGVATCCVVYLAACLAQPVGDCTSRQRRRQPCLRPMSRGPLVVVAILPK